MILKNQYHQIQSRDWILTTKQLFYFFSLYALKTKLKIKGLSYLWLKGLSPANASVSQLFSSKVHHSLSSINILPDSLHLLASALECQPSGHLTTKLFFSWSWYVPLQLLIHLIFHFQITYTYYNNVTTMFTILLLN